MTLSLQDVQSQAPELTLSLSRVGVTNVEKVIRIRANGSEQLYSALIPGRSRHTMLVLSRLRQQSIMIGHEIEVKIVEIIGDRVKLGFVAPNSVQILRREIYDKEYGSSGGDPPGSAEPKIPT